MKQVLSQMMNDQSGAAAAKYSLFAFLFTAAVAAAATGVGSNLEGMLVHHEAHHSKVKSGS